MNRVMRPGVALWLVLLAGVLAGAGWAGWLVWTKHQQAAARMADIEPRPGILFFGLVVVFTMLSAMSFDPRLIWDNAPDDEPLSDAPPPATPATDGATPDPTGA